MISYDIEDLTEDNKKEWDNFNEIIKDGSFYHTNRWKQILEKSFNLKPQSFIVRFKGEIGAISLLIPTVAPDIKMTFSLRSV